MDGQHVYLFLVISGANMYAQGNPDTHIILRGGKDGPNYTEEHVKAACQKLKKKGLPEKLMVRLWVLYPPFVRLILFVVLVGLNFIDRLLAWE